MTTTSLPVHSTSVASGVSALTTTSASASGLAAVPHGEGTFVDKNHPPLSLSRSSIGTLLKAQIVEVTPLNHLPNQNNTSTEISTTQPNTSLVYKALSLPNVAVVQPAALTLSNTSTVSPQTDSILLASINQKNQVIAKIDDRYFTFISSIPLRSGDSIVFKKLSAQMWQYIIYDNDHLAESTSTSTQARLFLPALLAKSHASPNWLQASWQLYGISQQLSNRNAIKSSDLTQINARHVLQSLQTPLKQFFAPMLSVQNLQEKLNFSSREPISNKNTGHIISAQMSSMNAMKLISLVKNAFNNSGLTFESKLSIFSQFSTHQQTALIEAWQKGSTHREDINFIHDQKMSLHKLYTALLTVKQSLASQGNDAPNNSQNAEWLTEIEKTLSSLTALLSSNKNNSILNNISSAPNQNEKQHPLWQNFFFPSLNETKAANTNKTEDNIASMVAQLLEQTKQQLNRTHVHQLQSLLQQDENPRTNNRSDNTLSYCFDLPMMTARGYDQVPIWIDGYRDTKTKKDKCKQQWRVVLAFDLPLFGKIVADCRLTTPNESTQPKTALHVQFFSENTTTKQFIDQHISKLSNALQEQGLEVSSLECRSPLPTLGDGRFQHNWVQLQA